MILECDYIDISKYRTTLKKHLDKILNRINDADMPCNIAYHIQSIIFICKAIQYKISRSDLDKIYRYVYQYSRYVVSDQLLEIVSMLLKIAHHAQCDQHVEILDLLDEYSRHVMWIPIGIIHDSYVRYYIRNIGNYIKQLYSNSHDSSQIKTMKYLVEKYRRELGIALFNTDFIKLYQNRYGIRELIQQNYPSLVDRLTPPN